MDNLLLFHIPESNQKKKVRVDHFIKTSSYLAYLCSFYLLWLRIWEVILFCLITTIRRHPLGS